MSTSLPREALVRIRKLAQLAVDLRRGEHFEITRLTILKSLCKESAVANCFVRYLAQKPGSASGKARAIPSIEANERTSLTSK